MAMPSHLKSKAFRERAEECRTLAESFRDAITRAKMLQVAADYESMAGSAESFEKGEAGRDLSNALSTSRSRLH